MPLHLTQQTWSPYFGGTTTFTATADELGYVDLAMSVKKLAHQNEAAVTLDKNLGLGKATPNALYISAKGESLTVENSGDEPEGNRYVITTANNWLGDSAQRFDLALLNFLKEKLPGRQIQAPASLQALRQFPELENTRLGQDVFYRRQDEVTDALRKQR